MKTRLCGLLIPICLCAVLPAARGDEGKGEPAPKPEPAADPFTDAGTGIAFPETLGSLPRQKAHRYKDPKLGMAVAYHDKSILRANVYVYDFGEEDIADGVASEAVKEQFALARKDIENAAARDYYKDLEKLAEATAEVQTPGGPRSFLSASFRYAQAPGPRVRFLGTNVSHLLLTGYRGKFVKVRFTYPEEKKAEGEKALAAFLEDLGKLMPVEKEKAEGKQ